MRAARRLVAAALAALAPAVAAASEFYGSAIEGEGPGYPLSLPQTLRGTVAVPVAQAPSRAAGTLAELYPTLAACWRRPPVLERAAAAEVTLRLSLRRDGTALGRPRITYAAGIPGRDRPAFVRAALDDLARCLPAGITPALGRAIAGRPIALRLVFRRPPPAA